ncbi:DUF4845 domain-containing protein [Hydrogenophaga sp. 5NK40-0174]|uniref:DUF4845 domain-containing protein n=1 Tax=Hydrogenophaga sp. 5NK40-0174 TaxID=3127649 RepID=UPI00333E392F
MKMQQRGITFVGLLVVGILVALAVIVVAQIVPTYTEYLSVKKAVRLAAAETTVTNVRAAFDKQALIDQVSSIESRDLEITKVDGEVVVEFAYDREIHLAGPAYLVMKYSGSSSDK